MARYDRLIGSAAEENKVIEIRGLKIDTTARRVWVNGEEKPFTTKEFDLLTFWLHTQIMYIQKMNYSARYGIWNRLETLQQLRFTLKRSVRR